MLSRDTHLAFEQTGWVGTRENLFSQAQAVLAADKRREKLHSSVVSKLTQQFKQWKDTGTIGSPEKKKATRPYIHRLHPKPDTALFGTEKVPRPINFCPGCGFDLRTIKFVDA